MERRDASLEWIFYELIKRQQKAKWRSLLAPAGIIYVTICVNSHELNIWITKISFYKLKQKKKKKMLLNELAKF